MGAGREGADAVWLLTSRWPNGQWCGWTVFTRRFWGNQYKWHDTFGKRWARLVTCQIRGHLPLRNVNDPGETPRWHCFRCERTADPMAESTVSEGRT